jgi:hypothetical protein
MNLILEDDYSCVRTCLSALKDVGKPRIISQAAARKPVEVG